MRADCRLTTLTTCPTRAVRIEYGSDSPFRLCARLPGRLLAPDRRGREWAGIKAARQSRASGDARVPVRQGGALPGARIFSGAAALSHAADRRERRRPIRARLLERGAR